MSDIGEPPHSPKNDSLAGSPALLRTLSKHFNCQSVSSRLAIDCFRPEFGSFSAPRTMSFGGRGHVDRLCFTQENLEVAQTRRAPERSFRGHDLAGKRRSNHEPENKAAHQSKRRSNDQSGKKRKGNKPFHYIVLLLEPFCVWKTIRGRCSSSHAEP